MLEAETAMHVATVAFGVSLVVSMPLTRLVRDWSVERGWVDRPDVGRKHHPQPTPPTGGLALFGAMLAGLIASVVVAEWAGGYRFAPTLAIVIVLAAAMMALGIADDIRALSVRKKFFAQAVIAIAAWLVGFRIEGGWGYQAGGWTLGMLSLPITMLWIIGITNAFNLLDGIDGLAAGAALFATGTLLVVSMVFGEWRTAAVLAALAGATAGFLRYNFNPASIFLGDSGSLLLGFLLALLSIESSQKSTTAFAVAVPLVSLGLPVLDTTVVIIRRFLSRKPLFEGDRRHIHHTLVERGFSPRGAVIILYGVCGLLGLISLTFLNPSGNTIGMALALLGVSVGVGLQQLKIPELRQLNQQVSRGLRHQRHLVAGNVSVVEMIERIRTVDRFDELTAALALGLAETTFAGVDLELPLSAAGVVTANRCDSSWLAPTVHVSASHGQVLKLRWRPDDKPLDIESPANELRFEFLIGPAITGARPARAVLRIYTGSETGYPVSTVCWFTQNAATEIQTAVQRLLAAATDTPVGFDANATARRLPALSRASSS